jgi:hypothetical protein
VSFYKHYLTIFPSIYLERTSNHAAKYKVTFEFLLISIIIYFVFSKLLPHVLYQPDPDRKAFQKHIASGLSCLLQNLEPLFFPDVSLALHSRIL